MEEGFSDLEYGISKEYLDITKKQLNEYIYVENKNENSENTYINLNNENAMCSNVSETSKGFLNAKKDLINKNIILDLCIKNYSKKDEDEDKKNDKNNNKNKQINKTKKENKNQYNVYIEKSNIYNLITRVHVEKNTSLNLVLIDRTGSFNNNNSKEMHEKNILESIVVKMEESSTVNIIKIDTNRINKYFNYVSYLDEKKSIANIYYGYFLDSKLLLDMSFNQKYIEKETNGNVYVVGILNNDSNKIFKGTLDFKRGCNNSVGKEEEITLFLKEKASSVSCPILLAAENNIEGTHSSNEGKYDENILKYMLARGIETDDAKFLIAQSKIFPLIDKIENKEIKKKVKENIIKIFNESKES